MTSNETTQSLPDDGSASTDSRLHAPRVVGRYVLLEKLGSGGAGIVYRAFDPALERQIAIKLLRTDRLTHARHGERLLREGRAIAQINHVNVVAVHDVGSVAGELFVAMELIDGPTLGAWLAGCPSRADIIDAFSQAAAGLSAAHARGIVHRDFKPDNAFVARGNRVVVGDFGLARATEDPTPTDELQQPASPAWDVPVTLPGATAGTPGYMSPEQLRGEVVDARSDQFALCVAMWEALYGVRPFRAAQAYQELVEIERQAPNVPARPLHRVPGWLAAVLRRGLASDPAARFPSMAALCHALDEGQRRRRRVRWSAATLLVLGLIVAAVVPAQLMGPVCPRPDERLIGVWDAARRRELLTKLESTRDASRAVLAKLVTDRLDRYAGRWVEAHQEACLATHVRHEQSARALDLRMHCLAERRRELSALSEALLSQPADAPLGAAFDALDALKPLATCEDAETLATGVAQLSDPAQVKEGARIRDELARARAILATGREQEALPIVRAALSAARSLGHTPLLAEAYLGEGRVLFDAGDFEQAQQAFSSAAHAAGLARHHSLLAEALTAILFQSFRLAPEKTKPSLLLAVVEPVVDQLPARSQARFEFQLAAAEGTRYQPQRALSFLASAEQSLTRDEDVARARVLYQRMRTLISGALDYKTGCEVAQSALAAARAAQGQFHPRVGEILTELGFCANVQGQREEAVRILEEALRILAMTRPANHRSLAKARMYLSHPLGRLGRADEALAALQLARPVYLAEVSAGGTSVKSVDVAIADTLQMAGRYGEARAAYERILEEHGSAPGSSPGFRAALWSNMGSASVLLGDFQRGLDACSEAATILRAHASDAMLANTLLCVGQAALGLGRVQDAVTALRSALAGDDEGALNRAETQFFLARALWKAGSSRDEALGLAREALVTFEATPERSRAMQASPEVIRAWLAERTARSK